MDAAYFVGKKEILSWVNDLLSLSIPKIEDTASGAVACQIVDACYPGSIKLSKVNFNAKQEYEFIQNYKVLQDAFDKLNIAKHIEVQKLIRAKYQDNLEMMQWLKAFFDSNYNQSEGKYDAVGRRAKCKGAKTGGVPTTASKSAAPSTTTTKSLAPAKSESSTSTSVVSVKEKENLKIENRKVTRTSDTYKSSSSDLAEIQSKLVDATSKNEELNKLNAELGLMVDGLEKERNFYFDKLQAIEVLLQNMGDAAENSLSAKIFKIL
jgi:RP/EB family microtubule-associated protein